MATGRGERVVLRAVVGASPAIHAYIWTALGGYGSTRAPGRSKRAAVTYVGRREGSANATFIATARTASRHCSMRLNGCG